MDDYVKIVWMIRPWGPLARICSENKSIAPSSCYDKKYKILEKISMAFQYRCQLHLPEAWGEPGGGCTACLLIGGDGGFNGIIMSAPRGHGIVYLACLTNGMHGIRVNKTNLALSRICLMQTLGHIFFETFSFDRAVLVALKKCVT